MVCRVTGLVIKLDPFLNVITAKNLYCSLPLQDFRRMGAQQSEKQICISAFDEKIHSRNSICFVEITFFCKNAKNKGYYISKLNNTCNPCTGTSRYIEVPHPTHQKKPTYMYRRSKLFYMPMDMWLGYVRAKIHHEGTTKSGRKENKLQKELANFLLLIEILSIFRAVFTFLRCRKSLPLNSFLEILIKKHESVLN